MTDTIDTLTRDACSPLHYGPKSQYRKRLEAWCVEAQHEAAVSTQISVTQSWLNAYRRTTGIENDPFTEAMQMSLKTIEEQENR